LRTRNDNVHNLLPGTMNGILYRTILFLLGFLVGIMTGLMGIGGGVVLVPLLVLVVGLPVEKAAGTSLGIVLVSAVSSTVKKGLSSDPKVSMLIVAALLCSSVVGVQLGIQLVRGIDRSRFSCFFSIVIACAIGLIFFDIIRVIQGLG
ncbi:MAG: TSUP family transporter, partial [Spirochaetota bacterium]